MKLTSANPLATQEEIAKLKMLVKKVPSANISPPPTPIPNPAPPEPPPVSESDKQSQASRDYQKYKRLYAGEIANVEITRDPLAVDNPVEWLLMLKPEMTPYRWQFEELMRLGGYLNHKDRKTKTDITYVHPLKVVMPAANGSGKDEVVIATFSTWLTVTGCRNRVIITSSSFDQTKFQTEVHIRDLANRANKKFGKIFHFTQFHYIVPELGSEIKLFATDEAGRAEGYHPFQNGKMALILNEAKTIREELFDAIDRCTGYSHLLYISSPAQRRGRMYKAAGSAIHYPNPAELGKFFCRKVTAFECPHIPKSHIDAQIYDKGIDSPWVKSSILAEFSDWDEPVVIPEILWDKCIETPPAPKGSDIGIGLDLAAGGDENSIHVREGNRLIFDFHFTQVDTEKAVLVIDNQLSPWKNADYIFRADDGGISHAMNDKLKLLGWRIRRTNNNSPAWRKSEFLNLGAEMYFSVRRLIERKDIILPVRNFKLKEQLTTRRFKGEESTQGKLALQSKPEARADGMSSPDRADSFVLCFSSYKPSYKPEEKKDDGPKKYTIKELLELERRGLLISKYNTLPPKQLGRPTQLVKI